MTAQLYLFDDARARRWAPFSLTRPIGELLHGCLLQRERWAMKWGMDCVGHFTSAGLRGYDEPGAPPVVAHADVEVDSLRILVSSRAVPSGLSTMSVPDRPTTLEMDGEVVGWVLPPDSPLPDEAALVEPNDAPDLGGERQEVAGRVLGWPWSLLEANADRIAADTHELPHEGGAFQLTDVPVMGAHSLSFGQRVTVGSGLVIDVRAGPVRLENDVEVQGPGRLEGPLYVGKGSQVLGGSIRHTSIGPGCRVRGEISTSVLLGFANKAHDGYLGHAYLGRWVNLGAMTTNSDLKNNYSEVRVTLPDAVIETGLTKVGCFLGDGVRTAIGTLLTTGSVVGAGSNVFGETSPPRYLPPFSWGSGNDLTTYDLEKYLETTEVVMGRRGLTLSPSARELLGRAWKATSNEKEAAQSR